MCAQCAAAGLPCSRASRSTTWAQMARSPSWPATASSAGTGKDRILVAPALWRKWLVSAALARSSTMRMLRRAAALSGAAACMARLAQRLNSRRGGSLRTPLAFCSSTVTFMVALGVTGSQCADRLAVVFVVGFHDALHDGVAHDVGRVEPGEAHALD